MNNLFLRYFLYENKIGSALGLMRLQDIYNLNTSQLSNGEISSKFKSKKLSGWLNTSSSFLIGLYLFL